MAKALGGAQSESTCCKLECVYWKLRLSNKSDAGASEQKGMGNCLWNIMVQSTASMGSWSLAGAFVANTVV